MKLPPARWSPAALIELLTVKKQCQRIFHGNEWMKERNYASQNADTRPRLQRRTQNIPVCFVISISAVILERMVKITPAFGSYRSLRIAWNDIFSLSHHLLASWNLYIIRVAESMSKNAHLLVSFNTWTSQRLLNWNLIPKLTIVLMWKTRACLKVGKTSNRAVENLLQRKLWVWAANDANFSVFFWVVRGAMHSD